MTTFIEGCAFTNSGGAFFLAESCVLESLNQRQPEWLGVNEVLSPEERRTSGEGVASHDNEHHTLVPCCYEQSQGQEKPMATGPFVYKSKIYKQTD